MFIMPCGNVYERKNIRKRIVKPIKPTTMKKNSLYKTLEKRGYDEETIIEMIEEMVEILSEGEYPEDVLFDYGLEPDYVLDLIEYAESM